MNIEGVAFGHPQSKAPAGPLQQALLLGDGKPRRDGTSGGSASSRNYALVLIPEASRHPNGICQYDVAKNSAARNLLILNGSFRHNMPCGRRARRVVLALRRKSRFAGFAGCIRHPPQAVGTIPSTRPSGGLFVSGARVVPLCGTGTLSLETSQQPMLGVARRRS